MAKTLTQLTAEIKKFAEARDWTNEDPNELLTSIYIELGELAEHYQWLKEFPEFDAAKKREIGYEFVDVLIYFLRLAQQSGIDIEQMYEEKVPKLAKKFPVGADSEQYQKNKREYRKSGKNKLYE